MAGHRAHDRAGGRSCQVAIPRSRSHVAPFDRLRIGGQGNGYSALAALPGPRIDHEYGSLHCHVTRTVQRYLEIIERRVLGFGPLNCAGGKMAKGEGRRSGAGAV